MLHPSRFWWIALAAGTLAAAPPSVSGPERDPAALGRARTALAQVPIRFESNQGQWQPAVRYRARTGGYMLSLTDRGATLDAAGGPSVELTMPGANPAPVLQPGGAQTVRTNYFVGARDGWHTGVANYSWVSYRGVYPGIDVIYYGSPRQLEYDFVVAPGADPRAIRMQFRGADVVRVTPAGDLEVEAAGGRVLQKKPAVYQDGHTVEGRYELIASNVVAVRLGAYDHSRRLVIDPVLAYATYMGGVADDQITVSRLDAEGRLYVAGSTATSSAPMIATPGAYDQSITGQADVFLAIIDTTGSLSGSQYGLLYLTYLGGSANDIPTGLQLDSQSNVYITGTTTSTNFPQVGNTVAVAAASYTMGFVAELNPAIYGANSLLYSTYLGGTDGNTFPHAIDVDAAGNIYVLGSCQADDFPVTSSAYQSVRWGAQDIFLAEMNASSTTLLYATYLGGELEDDGRAMIVTPAGLVYFAGSTESTLFPLAGNPYQSTLAGVNLGPNYDLIVGVIDPTKFGTASLIFSSYLGGSDNDELRGMTMDSKGNLVLTGYTVSSDFPVTSNAVQAAYGGAGDAFVTVVNPNVSGFLIYSTFLGGSDTEVGYAVATDTSGYIYVTGYTLSSDFPIRNAFQAAWGGLVDVFLTKLQPGVKGSAGISFSTYAGAQSINTSNTIQVASSGAIFLAGYTSGEFPVTSNAWQFTYAGGGTDAFVMAVTQ